MTAITELSTDTLAEMMGAEATPREAKIMMGLLSRDCVVDTDDINEQQWIQYLSEVVEIAKREQD